MSVVRCERIQTQGEAKRVNPRRLELGPLTTCDAPCSPHAHKMPRSCLSRVLCCTSLALFSILPVAAQSQSEVSVWRKVSSYLTKEALIELKDLPAPKNADEQRERDFCAAVVTLDQQPLSESRLDDVEARLKALLALRGDDEIANASRYLLGRIAQIYRGTPRMKEAESYYRAVLESNPFDAWAQLARVKLAVLELYVLPAESRQARIDAVLALIESSNDPVTLRDLHRLVARAGMFFNFPPELALKHLMIADEFGGLKGTLGADQLVQIGELAIDTRQPELSAHFYERLRQEYPRDPRIYIHDQRQAGRPVPQRREELNGR